MLALLQHAVYVHVAQSDFATEAILNTCAVFVICAVIGWHLPCRALHRPALPLPHLQQRQMKTEGKQEGLASANGKTLKWWMSEQ